ILGALAKRFPTNWELSAARATNVARFLQDETQVDPHLLSAGAYSEYRPRESNDTEEGRRKNRRIEILLGPPLPPAAAGDSPLRPDGPRLRAAGSGEPPPPPPRDCGPAPSRGSRPRPRASGGRRGSRGSWRCPTCRGSR